MVTHNYYSVKKINTARFCTIGFSSLNPASSSKETSQKNTVDKKEDPKKGTPAEKNEIKTDDKAIISNPAKTTLSSLPSVSLGFDDAKTGAPDKNKELTGSRFPYRGRDLYVPLFNFNSNGSYDFVNPLPASGLEKNKDGDGIALINPKYDAAGNFAAIDIPSQTVAALFDELSEKFPKVEKNVLYRLAKVGTFVAIDVPLMVASHEMGHGGAMVSTLPGSKPEVSVTSWMSGYTTYNIPRELNITEKQEIFVSIAGMNQATYNGEEVDRRMHTKGADIADAIEYLVNITNNANYQVKDWIKNSPPGYADGASYHAAMEARGKGWTQGNLSTLAVGVNLLNADFWASLIGGINYVATGKQVKMPELKIGEVHLSAPNFSLINTVEGPQVNTSIYGHMNTATTLELKYSSILTPDNGPAMGLETRLHNLYIPGTKDSLSISPGVGISTSNGDLGFKVGTGIEYRPMNNKNMAVTAGIDYRINYMPDSQLPLTGADGFQGNLGFKANFL